MQIQYVYRVNVRSVQRREVVMMRGHEAHEGRYNALGGTETDRKADYNIRRGTYEALTLTR